MKTKWRWIRSNLGAGAPLHNSLQSYYVPTTLNHARTVYSCHSQARRLFLVVFSCYALADGRTHTLTFGCRASWAYRTVLSSAPWCMDRTESAACLGCGSWRTGHDGKTSFWFVSAWTTENGRRGTVGGRVVSAPRDISLRAPHHTVLADTRNAVRIKTA